MSTNPVPYYDDLCLTPTPSPEPPFTLSFALRPDLSHKRLFPSPTPGTSIYSGVTSDGLSIEVTLVDDAADRELHVIGFAGTRDAEGWAQLRRGAGRLARGSGRTTGEVEVEAMMRAGEEAERVKKGELSEEECEGWSLEGAWETGEDEEGR